MRSSTSRRDPYCPAHPDDPWLGRLAFHLLQTAGAWWVTLWLLLILAALVTLAVVGEPWIPGAIGAAAGLVSGTAIAKARAQAAAHTFDFPPPPDLPPPP